PNGPGFTPGVPSAAIPGEMPPDMPGAPVPLPPAPPGARTVPLGPLPAPQDFTPGIAPLPPALTGPPPPPGPGADAGPAEPRPRPGGPPAPPPPPRRISRPDRRGAESMSTIFNIRNLKLPGVSRASVIIGTLVVILALVAGIVGWNLYRKLTTNTVVAYFPDTLALYAGDKVQIMGVQVGQIDAIEPAGDKMKVTFHYASKFKVPANATASILNPSLVASRNIQLSPPFTGGPVMEDNAVIPIDRTQVPVEDDQLRDSLNRILTDLGPTPEQPKGPFGDIIESAATGFAGKGEQLNKTLNGLSEALYTLNEGRGDLFGVIKSLALFVNALYQSDQQFVALNDDLATFTNSFTNTNREVANALQELNQLLTTTRQFISKNGEVLTHDVNNLADVTNAILQPDPLNGLETALHVFPNLAANLTNIVSPVTGGIMGLPVINNFANPLQFVCSAIQAGSRLGYQESAEMCAQYLAPILDAIKFNFPPFGLNNFTSAMTLPKQVAYSEPRLQPPGGYKDTTVPGIFSR